MTNADPHPVRTSGPGLVVRAAATSDDDALREIDLATWGPANSPAPPPPAEEPFFSERNPLTDHLVAELDGAVVGYVKLQQTVPIPSHEHVLTINGLAVAARAQGRGVGRALIEAAIARATRLGARKLSLRVLGPNAGARRLYEACGFEVEGVLRGEFVLAGVEVDDHLMARRLDDLSGG